MKHVFSGLVALGVTLSLIGQVKADYTFTTLDVPGSTYTEAFGINDAGQVVGAYKDIIGRFHGFLFDVDGTYTTFDPPGSGFTRATGINNSGQIVGYAAHGFLLDVDGTYTTFDPPGSTATDPRGINAYGQIVGQYVGDFVSHGFLATPQ